MNRIKFSRTESHKFSGIEIQTDHPIPTRRPGLVLISKKKRIWNPINFAVPADHIVKKKKESENENKSVDHAEELINLWNMKVTLIPIIIGAFGTVPRNIVKRRAETKTWEINENNSKTVLLRSARILWKVLETGRAHCHSDFREKKE